MQLIPLPRDNPLGFTIQILFVPLKSYCGKLFDNFSNISEISGNKSETLSFCGSLVVLLLLEVLFKNVSSFHFCSFSSLVKGFSSFLSLLFFFSSSNFFLSSNSFSCFIFSSSFSCIILSNFSFSICLSFS